MRTTILTTSILKEIKEVLNNADWTYDFSRNEGDSQKAVDYLQKQKFSIKYLNNYFKNCDTSYVQELMDEGVDMVTAFVREAAPVLAGERCKKFMWSGKYGTNGWNLETTCFKINI